MRRRGRAAAWGARRSTAVVLAALVVGLWSATPAAPGWLVGSASAAAAAIPGTVSQRPVDNTLNAANGEVRALAQIGSDVFLGGTFTKVGPARLGAAGVLRTRASAFAGRFPDVNGVVLAAVGDGHGGWFLGGSFTQVGAASRSNLVHVGRNERVAAWNVPADGPVRALALTSHGLIVGGDFTHLGGRTAAHLASVDVGTGRVRWTAGLNGTVDALATSPDGGTVFAGGAFTNASGATRDRALAADATTGRIKARFHPAVDATVRALAVDGSSLWLGGDFTRVDSQSQRHLARVSASDGAPQSSPSTDGVVLALRPDRAHRRMFVAGGFARIAGRIRPRLAAVTANGHVSRIRLADPTGDVRALTISHGALYLAGDFQISPEKTAPAVIAKVMLDSGAVRHAVPFEAAPASLTRAASSGGGVFALAVAPAGRVLVGGDFSDYGLVMRPHLAAFDTTTGALDRAFRPTVDGPVYTLKSSATGNAMFIGGAFRTVDGRSRHNLARLDTNGSLDTGFQADANAFVKDLAVSPDGRLYVAGPFVTLGGQPARHLAAVSATSGKLLTDFSMPISNPTNKVSDGVRAISLSPDARTLAVVGNFGSIAGVSRPLVALVDVGVSPAQVLPWRTTLYDTPCSRGRVGLMRDVAISPDGGQLFVVSAGAANYPACDSVNAFPMVPDASDVTPTWTARIGDSIETVVAAPGTVYIGGHFRVIDRTTWTNPRYHLAALDASTGRPLSWQPNANGFRGVRELELAPVGLLAGGDGRAFGGVAHGRLAVFAHPPRGLQLRVTGNRSWVPPSGADVTFDVTVSNTSTGSLTVSTLADNRLGSLDGVGTCAVPVTISAGTSSTCHYAAAVSGKAGTGVKRTLTASAGSATASDQVKTTMVANIPPLFTNVQVSPTQVRHPGGRVLIGVTVLNLDPVNALTVQQLTSNLWGSLTARCGFPKTVAPNGSVWCHLRRVVGGPAHSWVALSFTASGSVGPHSVSATGSTRVRVIREAPRLGAANAARHLPPGQRAAVPST